MTEILNKTPRVKYIVSYHEGAVVPKYIRFHPNRELFLQYKLPDTNNPFFENYIFKDDALSLQRLGNPDWVGHLTYSYMSKILPFEFNHFTHLLDTKYDIIGLRPFPHHFYSSVEHSHPGFLKIWDALLAKLGYQHYANHPTPMGFYCNYWIMKAEVYERYRQVTSKVIDLMLNDPEIKELVNNDSKYALKITKEKLIALTGRPFYPFHTFILERFVCFWASVEKLNVGVPSIQFVDIKDYNSSPSYVLSSLV